MSLYVKYLTWFNIINKLFKYCVEILKPPVTTSSTKLSDITCHIKCLNLSSTIKIETYSKNPLMIFGLRRTKCSEK